jgi:hypothetical protein
MKDYIPFMFHIPTTGMVHCGFFAADGLGRGSLFFQPSAQRRLFLEVPVPTDSVRDLRKSNRIV